MLAFATGLPGAADALLASRARPVSAVSSFGAVRNAVCLRRTIGLAAYCRLKFTSVRLVWLLSIFTQCSCVFRHHAVLRARQVRQHEADGAGAQRRALRGRVRIWRPGGELARDCSADSRCVASGAGAGPAVFDFFDALCCHCISACISERLCLCLCLQASVTWDENKIYGCVCDSAWEVGYGAGQTQATQWFGADCSLKRCPSGNDPRTSPLDETDCEW